jgi:hypothetical protein
VSRVLRLALLRHGKSRRMHHKKPNRYVEKFLTQHISKLERSDFAQSSVGVEPISHQTPTGNTTYQKIKPSSAAPSDRCHNHRAPKSLKNTARGTGHETGRPERHEVSEKDPRKRNMSDPPGEHATPTKVTVPPRRSSARTTYPERAASDTRCPTPHKKSESKTSVERSASYGRASPRENPGHQRPVKRSESERKSLAQPEELGHSRSATASDKKSSVPPEIPSYQRPTKSSVTGTRNSAQHGMPGSQGSMENRRQTMAKTEKARQATYERRAFPKSSPTSRPSHPQTTPKASMATQASTAAMQQKGVTPRENEKPQYHDPRKLRVDLQQEELRRKLDVPDEPTEQSRTFKDSSIAATLMTALGLTDNGQSRQLQERLENEKLVLRENHILKERMARLQRQNEDLNTAMSVLKSTNDQLQADCREVQLRTFKEMAKSSWTPLEDRVISEMLDDIHQRIEEWAEDNCLGSLEDIMEGLQVSEGVQLLKKCNEVANVSAEEFDRQMQLRDERSLDPTLLLTALASHHMYKSVFNNSFLALGAYDQPDQPFSLGEIMYSMYRELGRSTCSGIPNEAPCANAIYHS